MIFFCIGNFCGTFILSRITLTQPDDWHVHMRDGHALKDTVNATAQHFGRALVMPNLKPALTKVNELLAYRQRLIAHCTLNSAFKPYMTLYLNEQVSPATITECCKFDFILGAKLYPAGATTNSAEGVISLITLYPLLDMMQENNLVLQIHGEVTHGDIFNREKRFIIDELSLLTRNFPRLRIVLEHISTRAAVDFVTQASSYVAATITPHHLLYNRNHLLAGGIRPHYYCLPVLKSQQDQNALRQAAVSGNPKFFAGTDSAPHSQALKENACGCAGIYSAPFAIAFYAQVFDEMQQMHKLNAFLGHFGADFYQLPPNNSTLELIRKPQQIPLFLSFGDDKVVPMGAGEILHWSIND